MPSMFGVARSLFSACLGEVNGDKPMAQASSDEAREQALGTVLRPFFASGKAAWADLSAQLGLIGRQTDATPSHPSDTACGSRLIPLPASFVIQTYDQALLSRPCTRVHDPRARIKGPDCEVPVTRAGVPEPFPLDQLVVACEDAINRHLKPVAYGEKPEALMRLIRVARAIRTAVREGADDLPGFDPDIVLAACASEPAQERAQLTAEDITALLAFTFFQKAMTVSHTLRASIVVEPPAPIRAGPCRAEAETETETGRNPAGFRPVAGSRGPRDERRSAFDQSKV